MLRGVGGEVLFDIAASPASHDRGCICFAQFQRALIATDLDGVAADFHLNSIAIELAVASRTSLLGHDMNSF
jgi:hypothetical protein